MPDEEKVDAQDFRDAAHALVFGRDHRIRDVVLDVVKRSDNHEIGAWVPVDIWIPAEKVFEIKEEYRDMRRDLVKKHEEADKQRKVLEDETDLTITRD